MTSNDNNFQVVKTKVLNTDEIYLQGQQLPCNPETDVVIVGDCTTSTEGGSATSIHNELTGLQGGSTFERYHLNREEWVRLTTSDTRQVNLIAGPRITIGGSFPNFTITATQGFSGSYLDLTNKPTFATVATTGSYTDLINKPVIFNGDYNTLINRPTLFTGAYADLTGKPTIPSIAGLATENYVNSQGFIKTIGTIDYNTLINKPVLFSGSYNDLTDKPIIIDAYTKNQSDLRFKSINYVPTWSEITNKPSLFSGDYNDLINKPTLFDGNYTSLVGKPTTLSSFTNNLGNYGNWITKAQGDTYYRPIGYITTYAELTGKPTIPAQFTPIAGTNVTITGTYPNLTFSAATNSVTNSLEQTRLINNVVNGKIVFNGLSDYTANETGLVIVGSDTGAVGLLQIQKAGKYASINLHATDTPNIALVVNNGGLSIFDPNQQSGIGAIIKGAVQAEDAIQITQLATLGQVPNLIAGSNITLTKSGRDITVNGAAVTLQQVTTAGNTTANAIGITGTANVNYSINQMALRFREGFGSSIVDVENGAIGSSLLLYEEEVSLVHHTSTDAIELNSQLRLRKEDNTIAGAILNTRLDILPAIASTNAAQLSQVPNLIAGSNITLSQTGRNITINSTGGSGGNSYLFNKGLTLNGLTAQLGGDYTGTILVGDERRPSLILNGDIPGEGSYIGRYNFTLGGVSQSDVMPEVSYGIGGGGTNISDNDGAGGIDIYARSANMLTQTAIRVSNEELYIRDDYHLAGISYYNNYEANFGPNTLVTKNYVDNLIIPTTIDAIPTDGSNNAVSSNGTFDALSTKQVKISLTTNGTTGSATFDQSTGALNIPNVDGNVVHKTGAETINGEKRFNDSPTFNAPSTYWLSNGKTIMYYGAVSTIAPIVGATTYAALKFFSSVDGNAATSGTTIRPNTDLTNTSYNATVILPARSGTLSRKEELPTFISGTNISISQSINTEGSTEYTINSAGSGTVTNVSANGINGISASVATGTTTPVITIDGTGLIANQTAAVQTGGFNISGSAMIASTGDFQNYSTTDQVTNYERLRMFYSPGSAAWQIVSEKGGTGTIKPIQIIGATNTSIGINGLMLTFAGSSSAGAGFLDFSRTSTFTGAGSVATFKGLFSGSATIQNTLSVFPSISQSGTAGWRGIYISAVENTVGSGNRYLIDAGSNTAAANAGTHTSVFSVDINGVGTLAGAPSLANHIVRKQELDLKSNIASPTFTGTPLSTTAAAGNNTTQIATTAFVNTAITNASAQIVEVAGTTQALIGNRTYIFHATTLTTATLPTTNPSIGTLITLLGDGVGQFRISQNANQFIVSGNATTTVGTGGYIQTSTNNTTITLRYVNTNKWMVTSSNASPTIV